MKIKEREKQKEEKKVKKQNFQHREDVQELMRIYNLEMQEARKQPKLYYSQEGEVKRVK